MYWVLRLWWWWIAPEKKYDTRRYIREIRHRTYAAHFSNTIFFSSFLLFSWFLFFSTLLFFCCFFPFLHCKVLLIVSLFNLFSWFYYWVRYFKLSHLFLFSLHVLIDLQIVEMLHNGVEWEKKMKKNEEEMNRKKIALMARFMFDSKTEWIYCWLLFYVKNQMEHTIRSKMFEKNHKKHFFRL